MTCPDCDGDGTGGKPGTTCFRCDGSGELCALCGESIEYCDGACFIEDLVEMNADDESEASDG